ncbi:MAG: ASKHA domain-containing protein [Bacteroidota bacterium]
MSNFSLNGKTISCSTGQSLFDLAEGIFVHVPSSCKKQGKCKECLVEVRSGEEFLSAPALEEKHLAPGYRLACRTFIEREGEIKAETLKRADIKIEENGDRNINDFELDPLVHRNGNTVFLEDKAIAETSGALLGLVVDIGTTTVVIRLIDVEEGKIKASASFENPQRFAGTNVMSRIAYDTEVGKKKLKRVFTRQLSDTILSICDTPENIFEVIIGGNTTMRDIFFGLDVHSIGQKPYKSISEFAFENGEKDFTSVEKTAKEMRLPIHTKARVYGLPIIGGHVGADTSAGLLAIELIKEDKMVAFMDIGTNTEIVIGNKNKAITASSPSGPSFEGGGISCGMPALTGAVESVYIDEDDQIKIRTIDSEKPTGICGSGLMDVLGELSRKEKINEFGRFEEEIEKFYLDKDNQIFINENDINLLAQTKAANVAALKILVKEYGINFNEIDTFYLAGGFGEHIDLGACIRIGLLPDIPKEKFKKIGNATIEGLTIALLSKRKRTELEEFVKNIDQINLESDPDFFDHFVDGCLFQEIE